MASALPPAPQAIQEGFWVKIIKPIFDPETGQPSENFHVNLSVQIIHKEPRPIARSVAAPRSFANIYDTLYEIRKKAWVQDVNTEIVTSQSYDHMCPHTILKSISSSDELPFDPHGQNNEGLVTKDFRFRNVQRQIDYTIPAGTSVKVLWGPATSKGLVHRYNSNELPKWKFQVSFQPINLIIGSETFPYLVPADQLSFQPVGEPSDPPKPSAPSSRRPESSRAGPSSSSRPPNPSSGNPSLRPPSHLSRR